MIGQSKISEMLYNMIPNMILLDVSGSLQKGKKLNKGNNKITELRTILQRESQNS